MGLILLGSIMTVIKRDKKTSTTDLVEAIKQLNVLLKDQREDDAVEALNKASDKLQSAAAGSKEHKEAVKEIIDAFEGEHELMAYTYQRENSTEWSEADELSQVSSRVLSLARRFK